MKLRNDEMDRMLQSLSPALDDNGMVGYAAGRNHRKLNDGCAEWMNRKNEALAKYGTPVLDEDGNQTGTVELRPGTDNFEKFFDEMIPFAGISHEVEIFKIPVENAIGVLTGRQISDLYWMFEEGDESANA